MKKFLSIFIAVAMLMSFAGVFAGAQTAAAATATGINLTDAESYLEWYDGVPDFGAGGGYNINPDPATTDPDKYIYKMGDTIHGYLSVGLVAADVTTVAWKVELQKIDGTVIDTVNMAAGGVDFTMGTGNVSEDGEYKLVATSSGADFTPITFSTVFIKYNLAPDPIDDFSFSECTVAGSKTISGWITRGSGQTVLVPVDVYLAYPDDTLAGYYTVAALSSGQFTITFPFDPVNNVDHVGEYRIFIRDAYLDTNYDNDAMIYQTVDNTPGLKNVTLSTYVSPSILYKDLANQPFLIVATDDSENYVTGLLGTDFVLKYNTLLSPTFTVNEISAGFYRFVIDTTVTPTNAADLRFSTNATADYKASLNTVIIPLRDLAIFNPYIDVDAPKSIPGYGSGPYYACELARDVYDKLPCTIGNSLVIIPAIYDPVDTANYYVYIEDSDVNGPVTRVLPLTDNRYLIKEMGRITASIEATIWERADTSCPSWPISEYDMSTNACCHEYSKTFNICEVEGCFFGGIQLLGDNAIDSSTVMVGDKVAVRVSTTTTPPTPDLLCSCPYSIVHIYMVDDACAVLPDAFTVDTWGTGTKTVDEIWWNPVHATGTGIPELPIGFGQTDTELIILDCPIDITGLTFNYTNDSDCGDYHLVVQIFGTNKYYNSCGVLDETYPLQKELIDPISILPVVTELSSTYVITEGALDPDEILAGVYPTIDFTDPGFTLDDPTWVLPVAGTVTKTDTGYKVSLSCPLDDEGTFVIYGYAYDEDCKTKEEVTIEIPVILPEFTVQIGLLDGSVIDNDGIITEGVYEDIYVTATDPRGIHDFSANPCNWTLKVVAVDNDCGLPTSVVCYSLPSGCTHPSPITVGGYANPNTADDEAQFDLYFVSEGCAWIYVDTFTFVLPTVAVDPEEVPFTIPASATHVTFTVTDAHGHGAPGVEVGLGTTGFSSGAAGYGWSATAGVTGTNGEVDWAFVPPYSGMYGVGTVFGNVCILPCGWGGISTSATIEAVYQAPVLDTEAPVVTAAAGEVVEGAVTISGTVEDNVGVVSLYIGAMKVDFAPDDGAFSAVVALSEGENVIKVVAFDAAGNKGEVELTVDYAVPTVIVVKIQIGSDIMTVNGQIKQLDAVAEIKEGRTYLPLRAIVEALGAEVTWIPETKGITLVLGEHTVGLQIGNVSAVVDGNVIAIFPPYLKPYGDGTFAATMVPARLISEGLGAEVTWDPALRIVTITLIQP